MRTGSLGGRNVSDLLSSLGKEKQEVISQARVILLGLGCVEEVDYDPINLEPIMIYSHPALGDRKIFLKFKWETVAVILFQTNANAVVALKSVPKLKYGEEKMEGEQGPVGITIELKDQINEFSTIVKQIISVPSSSSHAEQ